MNKPLAPEQLAPAAELAALRAELDAELAPHRARAMAMGGLLTMIPVLLLLALPLASLDKLSLQHALRDIGNR